jgi:protein Hikeshi
MFGVFIPTRSVIPEMTTVSPNQFAISFPSTPPFHNVGVFLHPNNPLPPGTAAGVYMQLPTETSFKFLGAIANEKPSALFRVSLPDLSAQAPGAVGEVQLGISVEPVESIQAQMAQLQQQQGQSGTNAAAKTPDTRLLAQRIIKNAFNFLSSFAGNTANGVEVVPLKSFQDWWMKFERRVQNDPGFLERNEE